MFCRFCGKELPDGNSFCIHCGKKLTVEKPAAPAEKPKAAPTQAEKAAAKPVEKVVTKTGAGVKVVIALLIVIILALGVGGYFVVTEFVIPALEERDEKEDRDSKKNNKNEDGDQDPVDPLVSPTAPIAAEPANPYEAYLDLYTDYVLSGSDSTYKCYDDIRNMSNEELTLAEQEIYARHGQTFADANLQAYFDSRPWYSATGGSFYLNTYEEANLDLISVYRAKQDGTLYRSGNPYLALFVDSGDYTVIASNSRYLTASDLRYMTTDELCIVRNEILARHGYVFMDNDLREYFYSKPWYKPTTLAENFKMSDLNKYESNNITFVKAYERRAKGKTIPSGHEYSVEYGEYRYRDYFFTYSNSYYLDEYDLWNLPYLSANTLELARNEIYARHGYTFADEALMDYFMTKSWYFPTTPVGDQSVLNFSEVELANIKFLKEYEVAMENGYY